MDARINIIADSRQVRTAASDLQRLQTQGRRTDRAVNSTTKALGGVGRSAGQAGIQVQQLVGQVQGGVSPFVALSQQAADLGFVLGVPLLGAAVSIGAVLAGNLVPGLFDSSTATERLSDSLERLDDVITDIDGVTALSEDIARLADVSETVARARITSALLDVEDAFDNAAQAAVEALDEIDAGFGLSSIEDYTDRVRLATNASQGFLVTGRELGEQLGLTGEQAEDAGREVLALLSQLRNQPTPELFRELQTQLAGFIETGQASEDVIRAYSELTAIFLQAEEAADKQAFLNEKLANFSVEGAEAVTQANSIATAQERLRQQLEVSSVAFESGELAANKLAAAYRLGFESAEDLPPEIDRLITSLYQQEEASKAAAEAETERARAQTEAARAQAQAEQEFQRLQNELSTVGMSPEEQARAQYKARLEVIRDANATEEEARQARLAAEQALSDRLAEIEQQRTDNAKREAEARKQTQIQQLDATASFFGDVAQLAQNAGKEQFEAYKAAASVQAAIGAYSSAVKAYDALAGIPIVGPGLGAAAAATAIAFGLQQVANIQSQQYSPRALGGQVTQGGQYLVGERGPELITMGANGNVTPYNNLMRAAQGGNQNVKVIVENYGSERASTTESAMGDDRIIRVVVGDISKRGKIHRAVTQTTNAGNKVV